jgi:hypothetical protein
MANASANQALATEIWNCVETVQAELETGDEYRRLRRHIEEHFTSVNR